VRAFEAHSADGNLRVVLEEFAFGCYVLDFPIGARTPVRDDLYDDVAQAKHYCLIDFGISPAAWKPLSDHTFLMKS